MSTRARLLMALAVAGGAGGCATASGSTTATATATATAAAEPERSAPVVTRVIDMKRPSGSHRGFPVWLPELVSPELEPYYDRVAARFDPRSWFLWREQSPPRGFRGLRKSGKFPGGASATVRAFEFGYDRAYPLPAVVDGRKEGCGADALAADGTLCPSVVAPGVLLSDAQANELFSIVNEPEQVPRAILNGYDFAFSFVVFDAADTPVAEVNVDYSGVKLWSQPRQSRDTVDTLSSQRRERMGRLLVELGFKLVEGGALLKHDQEQRKLDGNSHPARYLPVSSGLPASLSLARTTDDERDRLCTWKNLLFQLGSPRSDEDGGSGVECSDGVRAVGGKPSECRSNFPRCSATVGEVEACLRHMRFDPCFEKPGGAACLTLRPCLLGMDWSLAPPQQFPP